VVKEITPWQKIPGIVAPVKEVDPDTAREVNPILTFGVVLPPFVLNPAGLDLRPVEHELPESSTKEETDEKVEAKAPAESDPKVDVTSSATDSASSSEVDTTESGLPEITSLTQLHPSFQPVIQEDPASAGKAPSTAPPPFLIP
jgi:hypothetical protein